MTYRLFLVHPRYGRTWQRTFVDPDPAPLQRAFLKLLHEAIERSEGVEVEVRR